MGGALRIGTSGYQYDDWRGVFYPSDLPKRRWLEHYARTFDTVEINSTFYRLPSADVFTGWRRQAPPGFLYAVKMSRFATHMKHLRDGASTIGLFLERARALGPTLGPILAQLPPRYRADPARLDEFLAAAPEAHRWAVELRDPSWLVEPVCDVLRRHGAALVIHDLLPAHPREPTADFTYMRFHGASGARYAGTYAGATLAKEARWIAGELDAGRDVYAYFNNDVGGHAVRDAIRLRAAIDRVDQAARRRAAGSTRSSRPSRRSPA